MQVKDGDLEEGGGLCTGLGSCSSLQGACVNVHACACWGIGVTRAYRWEGAVTDMYRCREQVCTLSRRQAMHAHMRCVHACGCHLYALMHGTRGGDWHP